MNFDELHAMIPYARFGKAKSLEMRPYAGITLAMPGRHAEDCSPRGGDFVVMVTDSGMKWKRHQFKHDDIFNDVETKRQFSLPNLSLLMSMYLKVIKGDDPDMVGSPGIMPGIDSVVFFHAVQCLAVAEHRRYHQYEDRFGGRYLPFRFAAGIAEGLWSAQDAIDKQKYGRPAVERLEKAKGVPALTAQLMS